MEATLKKPRRISREEFLAKQFILEYFVDTVIFPEDWTLDEVVDLHSLLLRESLKELTTGDKGQEAIKRKMDILEWIFAEDLTVEKDLSTGKVKITYLEDIPLSFLMCCRLENVDPNALREQIIGNLDKRWQQLLRKAKAA
jgi:hypothetical protein